MSKSTGNSNTQPDPRLANLAPEELASNQQGKSIAFLCGEAKIAANWISPVYKLFSKKVDMSRGGKK